MSRIFHGPLAAEFDGFLHSNGVSASDTGVPSFRSASSTDF